MTRFLLALLLLCSLSFKVYSQSALAKYGGDFLSTGAGARALGMGSTHSALANDVTAAYWNVAGLSRLKNNEVMYMHSERFDGIVGYDYGAAAMPLKNGNGAIAISFFRQGVDNIANTLNAWDPNRGDSGGPVENPEDYITKFSATDLGFYFSYATIKSEQLSYGLSAKIVHHHLGPFADAWGYSLDVGAQYHTRFADYGFSINDVTTMQKMWDVNENELEALNTIFGDTVSTGQNEYVLPSVKMGISKTFAFSNFDLITAIDTDLFFENRKAYYMNIGRMSIEPHIGSEITYKKRVSFRAGLTDFVDDPESGFTVSPTLGMGLKLSIFTLDYGFTSFAGTTSDLGYTHRISLKFDLKRKS